MESLDFILNFAREILAGPDQFSQSELSNLPAINLELADSVFRIAFGYSQKDPQWGWALMTALDQCVQQQTTELEIQARTAWWLAWAADKFARPGQVSEAAARARKAFGELGNQGWLAACDWIEHATPWMRNNFQQSTSVLKSALSRMQENKLEDWIPFCQLSLAFAQMLIGESQESTQNISEVFEYFRNAGNEVEAVRCSYFQANQLRRIGKFQEAIQIIEETQGFFRDRNLILDLAHSNYQLAICHSYLASNEGKVLGFYEEALETYQNLNLELWEALCWSGKASLFMFSGNLGKARIFYETSRVIFLRKNILGMSADIANDLGRLERLRGNPEKGIQYFYQAEEIYNRIGAGKFSLVAVNNLGKAYGEMGRYQEALYHLERALKDYQAYHHPSLVAGCHMYLAEIWCELNDLDKARDHIHQAEKIYSDAGIIQSLARAYLVEATIDQECRNSDSAIENIQRALELSLDYKAELTRARAYHLFGIIFGQKGEYLQGLEQLGKALEIYARTGMFIEESLCLISKAEVLWLSEEKRQAQITAKEAMISNLTGLPVVNKQANYLLGRIAETNSHKETAHGYFQAAIQALTKERWSFWQPSLAGNFMTRGNVVIEAAIRTANGLSELESVLKCMEAGKARTLQRRLISSDQNFGLDGSQKLADIRGEINWLYSQLEECGSRENLKNRFERVKEVKTWIRKKLLEYDQLAAMIERERQLKMESSGFNQPEFNLDEFRNIATRLHPQGWQALNYYLTDATLYIVWIDKSQIQSWSISMNSRSRMALRACDRNVSGRISVQEADLEILGELLIPGTVLEGLNSRSTLLISPHNRLHSVPWNALRFSGETGHLINRSIVQITPAFQISQLLWWRDSCGDPPAYENKAIFAVDNFQERYPPLPEVLMEFEVLSPEFSSEFRLSGSQAGLDNFQKMIAILRGSKSLIHIASHIQVDALTGRLAGIALLDMDLELDELSALAPLPDTVVLSGCSGIHSKYYSGDEQIGLTSSLFQGGTQTVIGSLWPVIDGDGLQLMEAFYQALGKSSSPVQALAFAQRELIREEREWWIWGSFQCIGI